MRGRARLVAPALLFSFAVAIVFVPSAAAGGGAATFQAHQDFATGTNPYSVAVADLNGDGRPDLVTADFFDGVSVLLGNGDGTFQAQRYYLIAGGAVSVAVGDVNGDGKPDIVTVNESDVSVLLGAGDGTFQAPHAYPTGRLPYSVAIGDLSGDGRPDIVTANVYGDSVSVLLGNGDGTFQANQDYAVGSGPGSVAVADLNGDGRLDVVTANPSAGSVSVLLGNGDGTLQAARDYMTGSEPRSPVIGDLNGDGRPDLVTANYGGQTVSVLLGNGDGTFQAKHDYPTGRANPLSVAVGDVNGDGKPDLVTANQRDYSLGSGDAVSVLLGNGDGTFQAPDDFASRASPNVVAVGDLNGDGRPDLVTANNDFPTGSVSVRLATDIPDTTPPSATPVLYFPNRAGWNNAAVTVYWNWIDNGVSSGMESASCPKTTTVTTEGVSDLVVTCGDVAGNTGSASKTVMLDETPPTLAPTLAQSVFPFEGRASLTVDPHASDALSGVAAASCEKVDTSWPGKWTLACTATDNAGNTATVKVPYVVARPLRAGRTTTCSARSGATAYYSGTGGSVRVPTGAVCVLVSGTHVKGHVVVDPGGTLSATGVTIDGYLRIAGSATVCGSRIGRSVSAGGGSLTLGGPGCAGNRIANSVSVSNETGDVWIWASTIRAGGLSVTRATGTTTSIVGNAVSGPLRVAQSGPPVVVSMNHSRTATCVNNAGQTGSGNVTHGTNTCPH